MGQKEKKTYAMRGKDFGTVEVCLGTGEEEAEQRSAMPLKSEEFWLVPT